MDCIGTYNYTNIVFDILKYFKTFDNINPSFNIIVIRSEVIITFY